MAANALVLDCAIGRDDGGSTVITNTQQVNREVGLVTGNDAVDWALEG